MTPWMERRYFPHLSHPRCYSCWRGLLGWGCSMERKHGDEFSWLPDCTPEFFVYKVRGVKFFALYSHIGLTAVFVKLKHVCHDDSCILFRCRKLFSTSSSMSGVLRVMVHMFPWRHRTAIWCFVTFLSLTKAKPQSSPSSFGEILPENILFHDDHADFDEHLWGHCSRKHSHFSTTMRGGVKNTHFSVAVCIIMFCVS